MKILVTGVKGQLGYDVVMEAQTRGIDAFGVDINDMDITDAAKVEEVMKSGRFDAVIHCAAWTAVDKAEEMIDMCYKVNVEGTRNIANICRELDIPLMFFSTDYVFEGNGDKPWDEYAERSPLNVYGKTKYEGEKIVEALPKHFIIRTSWVFGKNGNNFIKTMLKLSNENKVIRVVNDQVGAPTYTIDLARLVVDMIVTDRYGIYHASNEGYCSWYEFACEIFKQSNVNVLVEPVSSKEFSAKAKRPNNSRLAKTQLDKNGFKRLPSWQDALSRYLLYLEN